MCTISVVIIKILDAPRHLNALFQYSKLHITSSSGPISYLSSIVALAEIDSSLFHPPPPLRLGLDFLIV
jgi:hypothetical protein